MGISRHLFHEFCSGIYSVLLMSPERRRGCCRPWPWMGMMCAGWMASPSTLGSRSLLRMWGEMHHTHFLSGSPKDLSTKVQEELFNPLAGVDNVQQRSLARFSGQCHSHAMRSTCHPDQKTSCALLQKRWRLVLSVEPKNAKAHTYYKGLIRPRYNSCAAADTMKAGVWCDTKSIVMTSRKVRYSADVAVGDAAVDLRRYYRHATTAVGDLTFIYERLREVTGGRQQGSGGRLAATRVTRPDCPVRR